MTYRILLANGQYKEFTTLKELDEYHESLVREATRNITERFGPLSSETNDVRDSKIDQILADCTEEDWIGDDETRVTELNKEKAIPAIRTLITTESIQLLERLKARINASSSFHPLYAELDREQAIDTARNVAVGIFEDELTKLQEKK